MAQLVKQIAVKCGEQSAVCRWDNVEKVLMFQNRSKDVSMGLDDFMNRRQTTLSQAKKAGWTVEEKDVPIGSNWPTI